MKNKIQMYEIEWVDIKDVKIDSTNPNEMDKLKFGALKKIMKEKGMLQPIIIDKKGVIADGEHRYRVFQEYGMEKIPCYRLDITDAERRLLRQTMNKVRGTHNPRDDVEELIRLSKEFGVQDLSIYLGQEEKEMSDYLDSVNQVPESYLSLLIEERLKVKRQKFINIKLTDEQAKKLLDEMEGASLKDIVLVPLSGMLVDNVGK